MSPPPSEQLDELRRRVQGWRAAATRERMARAARGPLAPDEALDAAAELHELYRTVSVIGPDRLRAGQVQDVGAAWSRLKKRLGGARSR